MEPTRTQTRIARRRLPAILLAVLFFATALVAAKCEEPDPPKVESVWLAATPDGFVEVDPNRPYVYRAVAADGSAVGVRYRANEEDGSLEFWTEVFEREFTLAKGYRLAGTSDVTSSDGVAGKVLHLELAEKSRPYHYGLAIFVTEESLVTVETATELSELERYRPTFEATRSAVAVKLKEGADE